MWKSVNLWIFFSSFRIPRKENCPCYERLAALWRVGRVVAKASERGLSLTVTATIAKCRKIQNAKLEIKNIYEVLQPAVSIYKDCLSSICKTSFPFISSTFGAQSIMRKACAVQFEWKVQDFCNKPLCCLLNQTGPKYQEIMRNCLVVYSCWSTD